MKVASLLIAIALPITTSALAQNTPGQVVTGAGGVMIDGKPAARQGDTTTSGTIVSGSSNVFINGRPMVRQGDMTTGCAGK